MVIVSDGDDNQSRYTLGQALEMAQKADVVIYTISTNISRIETDGDKVLRHMASETGGQAFFPFKVEDLSQSFENIANELRHQYNIFYRPEPLKADGLYHKIEMRVTNRKDVVVRAAKATTPRGCRGKEPGSCEIIPTFTFSVFPVYIGTCQYSAPANGCICRASQQGQSHREHQIIMLPLPPGPGLFVPRRRSPNPHPNHLAHQSLKVPQPCGDL
jgi:hypothetical protein